MLRFGEFADRAMEQQYRLAVMAREVRGLRINLAALMLFRLLPIIFDFYYMPLETALGLYLPLRLALFPVIIAIMLMPVRPGTYAWRHVAILGLLSCILVLTSMTSIWVDKIGVGLTISFFVAIVVLMNYLFLPTRWTWMVGWGVLASLVHLGIFMPQSNASALQMQTATVMLCLANIVGALASWQLATLRRKDFLHLRQLEQANDELRRRETIIADQRDRLAGQVSALEEARQRLIDTQGDLVQAEKLAGLGGLVAGVAHELNTPMGIALTAITHLEDGVAALDKAVASGKLTRTQLADYQETLRDSARLVHANISRATELVQSFKRVAVDQASAERRDFLLGTYIDEVLQSLAPRLRGEPHRIRVDCPSGIHMDSYPGALFQVLTNLVINALIHAFRPGQAGTITIQARELPDDQVELRFSDDGRGVGPDHLGRLFEPFFTTNRARGGSGLGLHIVYNLVTQSLRGTITVTSVEGEGTCFTLTLPRHLDREGEELALERVAG